MELRGIVASEAPPAEPAGEGATRTSGVRFWRCGCNFKFLHGVNGSQALDSAAISGSWVGNPESEDLMTCSWAPEGMVFMAQTCLIKIKRLDLINDNGS